MTENEAKYYLLESMPIVGFKTHNEALDVAINALSEIQQYRAIGTVERLKHLEEYVDTINKLCADYSAIGTVEEFKALKEKATPKKLEIEKFWRYDDLMCPNCKSYKIRNPKYCCDCGQKLDWQ